ncbi:hypothetical protein STXM2123_3252 [Streptomyces sp. F-3]|nr:hypothetical protein STXM2123_3252 [Streptomyces sp. F-3]
MPPMVDERRPRREEGSEPCTVTDRTFPVVIASFAPAIHLAVTPRRPGVTQGPAGAPVACASLAAGRVTTTEFTRALSRPVHGGRSRQGARRTVRPRHARTPRHVAGDELPALFHAGLRAGGHEDAHGRRAAGDATERTAQAGWIARTVLRAVLERTGGGEASAGTVRRALDRGLAVGTGGLTPPLRWRTPDLLASSGFVPAGRCGGDPAGGAAGPAGAGRGGVRRDGEEPEDADLDRPVRVPSPLGRPGHGPAGVTARSAGAG